MAEPELRISGSEVSVRSGRKTLARAPVADFVATVARAAGGAVDVLLPRGVRLFRQRGDVTGVAVELAPGARTVRWITDDSRAPFGRGARYRECFLSFPYVILLLVLYRGHLTGYQQLYYRVAPLESPDDPLLLTNLYNVAEGYEQRSWVCLQHLNVAPTATFAQTVSAAVDHVFSAAFNRSSDVHEGNSYWATMRDLDPRVATLDAWEEATRVDRWFAIQVPWKPAGATAGGELTAMLDRVDRPLPEKPTATHLAGLVTRTRARRMRR